MFALISCSKTPSNDEVINDFKSLYPDSHSHSVKLLMQETVASEYRIEFKLKDKNQKFSSFLLYSENGFSRWKLSKASEPKAIN
jgi:hypothetical protein